MSFTVVAWNTLFWVFLWQRWIDRDIELAAACLSCHCCCVKRWGLFSGLVWLGQQKGMYSHQRFGSAGRRCTRPGSGSGGYGCVTVTFTSVSSSVTCQLSKTGSLVSILLFFRESYGLERDQRKPVMLWTGDLIVSDHFAQMFLECNSLLIHSCCRSGPLEIFQESLIVSCIASHCSHSKDH